MIRYTELCEQPQQPVMEFWKPICLSR